MSACNNVEGWLGSWNVLRAATGLPTLTRGKMKSIVRREGMQTAVLEMMWLESYAPKRFRLPLGWWRDFATVANCSKIGVDKESVV